MDDLESIVVLNHRRTPIVTTHHVAIQLDSDARGWKIELGNQFRKRQRSGEFFGFAVDVNSQNDFPTSFHRENDAAQFGSLILHHCAYEHRSAAGRELGNLGRDGGHAVALRL